MDEFYEILDLIYKLNAKYPELRFGQLIDWAYNPNIEKMFYLSNEEVITRLKYLLETEE